MRKWITFLMTLLVGSGVSYANAGMGQVEFEAGYRHDNISWRHRVPSCDPFIKESTRFHDLDIFQIGLSGRTTLGCNLYLPRMRLLGLGFRWGLPRKRNRLQ